MSTCPSCAGELVQTHDGFDVCRRCGVSENGDRLLCEILDDTERFVRRYVVFVNNAQAAAVTLHVAHTHAIEAADTTGYLHVRSAEKRSGKTRLLECLEMVVRMPIRSTTISPAALYRLLDVQRRTLLLDEVDSIFSPKADREELRGLLNAGYRRGSLAYRIETKGKEMVPRAFDAFGAKVLAGIGNLPDTIADRCIPIELRRRRKDEPVRPFRYRDALRDAEDIRSRFEQWVRMPNTIGTLRAARPELPELEDDRALEAWEPLIAIADAAHGGWPERARAALVALHGDRMADTGTGIATLAAIRDLFGDRDRISTVEILRGLVHRDDGPWAFWWADELDRAERDNRAPLKAMRSLRRELERYHITLPESGTIRMDDGSTAKGYYRQAFEDVWSRYLPVESDTTDTTVTPQVEALRSENGNRHTVTNRHALTRDVTDVTDVSVPQGTDSEPAIEMLIVLYRESRGDWNAIARTISTQGFRTPTGESWTGPKVKATFGTRMAEQLARAAS